MPDTPNTVPALIDALGGNAAVAKVLDKGASTVSEMRRSGSIKVRYWPTLIAHAKKIGVAGITSDALMRICAETAEAAR